MKKRHLLLVALSLILSICMCFGLAACSSCNDDETPTVLATPVVTIDNTGKASWEAVDGASSYAYKINDGTEVETSELSRQLSDGQKIAVKAVGDGKNFSDSEWSEAKTYTAPAPQPVQLSKPVVTLNGNVASWVHVPNATNYIYKVDDGEEVRTGGLSHELNDGETIVVKALGNGTTYSDSVWSDPVKYTAPDVPDNPEQLPKPELSLDQATGVVSWTADPHASKYQYSTDDGETWQDATGNSVTLNDGQSVIVIAKGDGVRYSDSLPTDPLFYDADDTPTPPPAHTNHTWGTEYTSAGADGHYRTCTFEGCNAHSDNEAHDYDNETDATCNKCGYERTIEGGDTPTPPPAHTNHTWGTEYTSAGADGHYLTCTFEGCNAHSANEAHVYDNDADATCNKCDYEREIETPDPAPAGTLKAETTIKDYAEAHNWEKGTKYTEINLDQNITVTTSKHTNTGKYYDTNHDWRIYQNESPLLKISANLGYEIVSVTIIYKSDKTGILANKADKTQTYSSETEINGVTEFTVANTKSDVANGNIQITAIKVIYKKVAIELGTPEVTVDDYGVVTWTEVEHADGYAYKIGDGETVTVAKNAELKYDKLTNGQSIKVWAVGDGTDYKDGKPATGEYVQTQLVMTEVTVDEAGMARWNAVEGASGYEYILLDKDDNKVGEGELDKDTCFKQLADGQKIQVKAIGEGKYITSSLTAPSDIFEAPPEKAVCKIPEFEIARNGEVTIDTVTGAGSYEYVIITAGVEADPIDVTNLDTLNLELKDGQSIKVKAVGNNTSHTSSTYSEAVEYKQPNTLSAPSSITVSPEGTTKGTVTVSFAKVDHATGYKYIVTENANDEVVAANAIQATCKEKEGTISFNLELAENEFIRVLAVGDEKAETYTPAGKGDYSNGYNSSPLSAATQFTIDNTKTYSVSEILPVIAYYGTMESANSFKISGTISANSRYLNGEKGVTLTLQEDDNTVALFAAQVGADFEKLAEDKLIGITVTAEGKVKMYQNAPQFSKPAVTLGISNAQRFNLAVEVLREMKPDLEKDHTENFTLPVTLFGATVTWSIKLSGDALTAAEAAFAIDNNTGIVTITPAATDTEIPLQAELSIDTDKYTDAESELLFATKVPADTGEITAIFNSSYVAEHNWTTSAGSTVKTYTHLDLDSVVSADIAGGNSGSWWGSDWRFYEVKNSNSTLTFNTTPNYLITSITITYTVGNNGALIYNSTNYNKDQSPLTIDNINSQSVVFGVTHIAGTSNGQIKISEIKVKYKALSDDVLVDTALKEALKEVKDSYSANFELPNTVNGLDVIWGPDNSAIKFSRGADKTTAEVTQPEDNDVTVNVTATITLNGVTKSNSKTVTIKKATQGGVDPDPVTEIAVLKLSSTDITVVNASASSGYDKAKGSREILGEDKTTKYTVSTADVMNQSNLIQFKNSTNAKLEVNGIFTKIEIIISGTVEPKVYADNIEITGTQDSTNTKLYTFIISSTDSQTIKITKGSALTKASSITFYGKSAV